MEEFTLAELVSALDVVVMEQNAGLCFTGIAKISEWIIALNPETPKDSGFRPDRHFAFLTNFLFDAEKFWAAKGSGQPPSGPWRGRKSSLET